MAIPSREKPGKDSREIIKGLDTIHGKNVEGAGTVSGEKTRLEQ